MTITSTCAISLFFPTAFISHLLFLKSLKFFGVSFCSAFAGLVLGILDLWLRLPENTAIEIRTKMQYRKKKMTEYHTQV